MEFDASDARFIPVPFIKLAKETAGTTLAKNIVTLGILSELFGLPQKRLKSAVTGKFSKKKAGVLEANLKGFEAGIDFAKAMKNDVADRRLEYTPGEPMLLMSGNEACAIGALHAGCRFFAGYPITPSSESAEELLDEARALERAGIFALVLEGIPDEVSTTISRSLSIPPISTTQ